MLLLMQMLSVSFVLFSFFRYLKLTSCVEDTMNF